MKNEKNNFLASLDIIDREMEKFVPFILQDLKSLGSIPEYIYQLLHENVILKNINTVIDFGCGKGAVLTYLAGKFNFKGLGVDLVPEFIDSAKQNAFDAGFINELNFEVGNIPDFLQKKEKYDVVIYGYDSTLLGNVSETLLKLSKCLNKPGYIVLEIAYTPNSEQPTSGLPSEGELLQQLYAGKLEIAGKITWDRKKIEKTNQNNTRYISHRIDQLKINYPNYSKFFERYLKQQINECKLIENKLICSTWLLKN